MRLPDSFLLSVFVCSLCAVFLGGCSREPSTSDVVMTLLPFILIFIIMYFGIIRPQQKKAKDHMLTTGEKKLFWEINRKFKGASLVFFGALFFVMFFIDPNAGTKMHRLAYELNVPVVIPGLIATFGTIMMVLVGLWLLLGTSNEIGHLGQQPPTERTATNKNLFCNHCGERLLDGDRFCGQCGAQVS